MRMFLFFGPKAKYESFNWFENFMGGHIDIGKTTIYGANAMCWAVNIHTKKWGYICFTLPSVRRMKIKNQGHYFYLSPNGTPWASTFYRGFDKDEIIRAQIRKLNFGHNFDTQKHWNKLRCMREKFSWFKVNDYDLLKFKPSED